jgi:hypothetical protein
MGKKRMTLEQADAARRRAVRMLENFGDEDGAAEFDEMSAEEYAEHKGIEVTNGTPRSAGIAHVNLHPNRRRRPIMPKSQRVIELEDTISDIYDTVQESGTTRADMQDALDTIADFCTEAVPALKPDDDEDSDEEEGSNNEEEEDSEPED